jgi:putative addiction module component (TIGR02574 family)
MAPSLKSLGLDQLDVAERLDLMGEIWDSIADEQAAVPLPEWQRQEILRRSAAFDADGNGGRSAAEVVQDIKRRL